LYQRPRFLNRAAAARHDLDPSIALRRRATPAVESAPRQEGDGRCAVEAAADDVRLGRLTLDDLDEARALWEATGMWLRPSDAPEQMAMLLTREPDLQLAARDGSGRLVGTALGGWDGRRAYVYHLAVAPNAQRRGVGGRLMDELEERFRARGALKAKLQVLAGNEVSRAFFAARGYLVESDCEPWGKELVPGGAPPGRC
jgi:ribosomal protein S18 acetylase RimI-like enzyme